MRAPVAPRGCPRATAPPSHVDLVLGQVEHSRRPDRYGGERLVDLDEVQVEGSRPAFFRATRRASAGRSWRVASPPPIWP